VRFSQANPAAKTIGQDAYNGAVGEHLARRWGLDIPAWADDPRRFLDEPCFPEYMELAKPVFLRDSPIAFRAPPDFHRGRTVAPGALSERSLKITFPRCLPDVLS
jgi:hypothetical protein